MKPTLEVGDYIVVTKWSFGYGRYSFAPFEGLLPHGRLFARHPTRGQVVVFRPTPEPDRDLIKRVIGLPGDRIQMIEGRLYINGQGVPRQSLGMVPFLDENRQIQQVEAYRETLPNGVSYVVHEISGDRGYLDNTGVFVVPPEHYFMMGDNRDNSEDSRTQMVSYVPFDNLVGPAQFVVVSFDSTTSLFKPWTLFTGFRPQRFFKKVE
jgi:signal peptidase I